MKKAWHRRVMQEEKCWWCEQEVPAHKRSAEHLIPQRYVSNNSKKNVKMACYECNSLRSQLEDVYSSYLKGSIEVDRYKERIAIVLNRINSQLLNNFFSCVKSKKVIDYYKGRWPTKWQLHPFQPDILERLNLCLSL